MQRLLVLGAIAALSAGCAGTRPAVTAEPGTPAPLQAGDVAVAGWRVPFECLDLSERIESSQARLYDASAGAFSTLRATDERRLRALESRADELGCLVSGSPYSY
jgi:hypothetical protein